MLSNQAFKGLGHLHDKIQFFLVTKKNSREKSAIELSYQKLTEESRGPNLTKNPFLMSKRGSEEAIGSNLRVFDFDPLKKQSESVHIEAFPVLFQ